MVIMRMLFFQNSALTASIASVVELVDTLDLGSSASRRGGSSPFSRTINIDNQQLTMLLPKKVPDFTSGTFFLCLSTLSLYEQKSIKISS